MEDDPMFAVDTLPATPLAALIGAALLVALLDPDGALDRALVEATRLLTTFDGLLGLERAAPADLQALGGLSQHQAVQIQAALALARRLVRAERPDPRFVHSPGDIGPLLVAEMRPLEQEVFRVILLKTDGALLKMVDLYAGTHSSTTLEIAEVFREPIRLGTDKILLVHNHPSHSLIGLTRWGRHRSAP
jgi:DNA repair protein RadC